MERFATNAGDVLVGTSHRKNALSNRPILVGADLLIDAGHTVQMHHFFLKPVFYIYHLTKGASISV